MSFLNSLPLQPIVIAMNVVGILGGVLLCYGIFLEVERRCDFVFIVGSFALGCYSFLVGNKIFTATMALLLVLNLWEVIQIYRGKHVHSDKLVEEYKHPKT